MIKKFPNKKYQIIYADPPWNTGYVYGGKKAGTVGGGKIVPYNVMTDNEIMNLPIDIIADNNCFLFLWVIDSRIPQVEKIMNSWGFKYSGTSFIWNKRSINNPELVRTTLTPYTRRSCEICFLGTKGKTLKMLNDRYVLQFVNEPIPDRRIHSSKPNEVRNRIVRLCGDLPRIELFARHKAKGWDAWGNEELEEAYIQESLEVKVIK